MKEIIQAILDSAGIDMKCIKTDGEFYSLAVCAKDRTLLFDVDITDNKLVCFMEFG